MELSHRKSDIKQQIDEQRSMLEEEELQLLRRHENERQRLQEQWRKFQLEAEVEMELEESKVKRKNAEAKLHVKNELPDVEESMEGNLKALPYESKHEIICRYLKGIPEDSSHGEKQADYDRIIGEHSTIKLAEANLKTRDPKIKTLDGNMKNYPAFKASFGKFERQGIYSEDELLDLLLTHVAGKGERALREILPGSGKYRRAWDVLQERFGDPNGIILAHDADLRNHSNVSGRNVEQLRSLTETGCVFVATFESLGHDYELKSASHVRQALGKLPPFLKIA